MKILYQKPEGVRDIYGSEYEQLEYLSGQVDSLFKSFGYRFIQTPSFEFIPVFDKDKGTAHTSDLFKLVDKEGHTLVLRPDFTPAVARAAAMYFQDVETPIRLCYKGSVFLNSTNFKGKLKESMQMGVELINDDTVAADAELIRLACEIMKSCGILNFRVSIGNVAYFKALAEEASLPAETVDELRSMLTQKNQFGAQEIIESLEMPESLKKTFLALPMLLGGEEVLDKANELTDNAAAKEAVQRLKELYALCRDAGCEKYIVFDFGMLSDYTYYTGIIFNALTYGTGDAVIKGGRYDHFLEKFGKNGPAIGLTASMDAILAVFQGQKEETEETAGEGMRYLTIALPKGRLADKTMKILEAAGITCEEFSDPDTRKLIFVNEEYRLKFFLAKGPDVPTFVEYGAADIGIVGKDTLLEEGRNVYEVLDLRFGKCRMCVCGPEAARASLNSGSLIKVATKYPVIARDYFHKKKNQTVELIKLNGSIELAPIVGLSDVIVDIVETGKTLRDNGLSVLEEILSLSARMIVNPVSMKMEDKRISMLIAAVKQQISK